MMDALAMLMYKEKGLVMIDGLMKKIKRSFANNAISLIKL